MAKRCWRIFAASLALLAGGLSAAGAAEIVVPVASFDSPPTKFADPLVAVGKACHRTFAVVGGGMTNGTSLGTVANSSGRAAFSDAVAGCPRRFYQAVLLP